ncbi:hypothetical protein Mapa_012120 [Marchantia paleacea]|nr:hypothetical protein Mapa_012120 [Marchantia paleacea]
MLLQQRLQRIGSRTVQKLVEVMEKSPLRNVPCPLQTVVDEQHLTSIVCRVILHIEDIHYLDHSCLDERIQHCKFAFVG